MVPQNPSLGDSIEIVCTIKRGSLPVTFSWLHNGQVVSVEKQKKVMFNERSSHFSIGHIQSSDIGNYTCVVSLCDDPPVLNPMYIPPNLAIGDNIELSCIVKRGSSPIQIDWQHNAKKISSLHKRKIINYESSSHLSIGKIQPDDVGNYTCVAKNNIGQDSNTVLLMIEDDKQPPILTPMYVPPNLAINDITEIYCIIKRGTFPVSFTWFHNDVEITGMKNYKITNSETSSHLSIGKIQASDIGNYTCKATNRFGHDSGTVSVLIE
ncbi:titin, partial [Trichonephila inaurata madagascariensis]